MVMRSRDPKEQAMGLKVFATDTPGIGGTLKLDPQHFRVDEVSRYPVPHPNGRVTILRVEALEIEQNELFRRLTAALSLPPGVIGFAGTKDRRALTTQLVSIPGGPLRLDDLHLSGVRILESYRAEEGLFLGHLYGNYFDIRVSGVGTNPEATSDLIRSTARSLEALGGFPNFFGPQRFGEIRPVTHLVGRALVLHSVTEAVETYLTAEAEGETGDGKEARRAYREHHDAERALREFPHHLRFERVLLDRLARGDPPERAFRALPRHLKSLFVHAYQSFLFNEYLSLRIQEGLPLGQPIAGDILIRRGVDGLPGALPPVVVSSDNLREATTLVANGRAAVAAPLVGLESADLHDLPAELLNRVLEAEGVTKSDFHLEDVPKLSSSGDARVLEARLSHGFFQQPMEWATEGMPRFRFCLDKGTYATTLMREFMKATAN